eukprot:TRINITY_DN40796_c0_g1_i1.p1 TRINITY_DN40796_c0_g1~~TRINITY_DN40796_c0_g1_i1.p1  ORF type:complete len:211 (-),score=38.36 TRINITY_DN40796_c0_g1_i1:288-920(-)
MAVMTEIFKAAGLIALTCLVDEEMRSQLVVFTLIQMTVLVSSLFQQRSDESIGSKKKLEWDNDAEMTSPSAIVSSIISDLKNCWDTRSIPSEYVASACLMTAVSLYVNEFQKDEFPTFQEFVSLLLGLVMRAAMAFGFVYFLEGKLRQKPRDTPECSCGESCCTRRADFELCPYSEEYWSDLDVVGPSKGTEKTENEISVDLSDVYLSLS